MIVKCIGYGSWGCRPGRKLDLPEGQAWTLINEGVAEAVGVGTPVASASAIVIEFDPADQDGIFDDEDDLIIAKLLKGE